MTWADKYELLLKDELNTQEISRVLGIGLKKARELRREIHARQKENGEPLPDPKKMPTELLLKYTGLNIKHFEDKMIREAKLKKYRGET